MADKKAAADDLFDALKKGDRAGFRDALEEFVYLCHEEDDEEEDPEEVAADDVLGVMTS